MQPNPTPANDNNQRPAEFDAALVQWLPWLRKMAWRLERNAQDREDLVNEAVAAACRRWQAYRPEFKFSSWLAYQIRECAHAMHKKRRVLTTSMDAVRPSNYDDDGVPSGRNRNPSGAEDARQEGIVELTQVLDHMEGRGKTVLLRRAMGDELHDIGDEWGISRERVRQIEVRAREKLLKALAA